METRLRPPVAHGWLIAVVLALGFAAMRVVGVLGPNSLRWVLPLGFVLMALTPYLLLDAAGRRAIGLRLPANAQLYPIALLSGGAAALVCFALGYGLFGGGADHWFATIANNYRQVVDTTGWTAARLHLFFTLPALILARSAKRSSSAVTCSTRSSGGLANARAP
jgi:hypothetical protein